MDQSKIAVRYGKALFELAVENKLLDTVYHDIQLVSSLCAQPEIQYLIDYPAIKVGDKIHVFDTLLKEKINKLTLSFIRMVIENKREGHLPSICRNMNSRYHKHLNIKQAHLVTATPIDQALKAKIDSIISDMLKAKIELSVSENEKLIGGFILRIDDKELDTSVATKLKIIKQRFIATSI
jgi:F-type H+-transporting ATPase subunit delta